MQGFFTAFDNIDRRILYVLLAVVIVIPLVKPMGLPIGMSAETQKLYDTIEALPKGSIVIVSPDYSPGAEPELWPSTLAVTKHLFRKGHKVIGLSVWPEGIMYAQRAILSVAKDYPNLKYGEDYVILPYKAGRQNAIAAMAKDFIGLYQTDYEGKPTSNMPLVQAIKSPSNIDLIVGWQTGDDLTYYIQQMQSIYKVKVAGAATSVSVPGMMPYVTSGQLSGFVAGLKGAAEYEQIIKSPGLASSGMDAQSLSHLLVMAFILLGNIAYLSSRSAGKKGR